MAVARAKMISIVCDYPKGAKTLEDELRSFLPSDVVYVLRDRQNLREFLKSTEDCDDKFEECFVFALPKASGAIVYRENDIPYSFYLEINACVSRCGGNVMLGDIRRVIIIVYNWKDDVDKDVLHHEDITYLWKAGVQPDLVIFKNVLFTLQSHSFNELQKEKSRLIFGLSIPPDSEAKVLEYLKDFWKVVAECGWAAGKSLGSSSISVKKAVVGACKWAKNTCGKYFRQEMLTFPLAMVSAWKKRIFKFLK
eukprot:m.9780 g.9780  ORF g.9780 m.9780 type:complete len:252 (+) comp21639_c0_seq3:56-811(+)